MDICGGTFAYEPSHLALRNNKTFSFFKHTHSEAEGGPREDESDTMRYTTQEAEQEDGVHTG